MDGLREAHARTAGAAYTCRIYGMSERHMTGRLHHVTWSPVAMVKVLPSNFTFYESQRILSPAGEPLAIACSNELLFIAVEECMIEAYDLRTLEQLAQFCTVSPVAQVA